MKIPRKRLMVWSGGAGLVIAIVLFVGTTTGEKTNELTTAVKRGDFQVVLAVALVDVFQII